MRYWMTYRAKDPTPNPETTARIGALSKEMADKGVLLDSGALLPPSQGARVNLDAGTFTVSTALARQFMECAGEGELELRPIVGGGDAPHH